MVFLLRFQCLVIGLLFVAVHGYASDGDKIELKMFPQSVGLEIDGQLFCSGTLVGSNPPTLLTAAHCLEIEGIEKMKTQYQDESTKAPVSLVYKKSVRPESRDTLLARLKQAEEERKNDGSSPGWFEEMLQRGLNQTDLGIVILEGKLPESFQAPLVATDRSQVPASLRIVSFGLGPDANNTLTLTKRTGIARTLGKGQLGAPGFYTYMSWSKRDHQHDPMIFKGDSGGSGFRTKWNYDSKKEEQEPKTVLSGVVTLYGKAAELADDLLRLGKLEGFIRSSYLVDLRSDDSHRFLRAAQKDVGAHIQFEPLPSSAK